jgi:hypothetical protein
MITMSVRAYRVNKKELAENCSFNCWHDADILDFFVEHGFYDGRNDDGGGAIDVPVTTLEKVLTKYPWEAGEDYRRDAIQADIAWAREHNRETVEYDCF